MQVFNERHEYQSIACIYEAIETCSAILPMKHNVLFTSFSAIIHSKKAIHSFPLGEHLLFARMKKTKVAKFLVDVANEHKGIDELPHSCYHACNLTLS